MRLVCYLISCAKTYLGIHLLGELRKQAWAMQREMSSKCLLDNLELSKITILFNGYK